MPANLENSGVATGLEKVSFHSNPKERQCQRMFKQVHNCTHFTFQQDYAQNPLSQPSAVHDLKIPDVQAGFIKDRRTGDQIAIIHWIMEKAKEFQKNIYLCFIDYAKDLTVSITKKLQEILKEMRIPDHLTCLLRNLYAG